MSCGGCNGGVGYDICMSCGCCNDGSGCERGGERRLKELIKNKYYIEINFRINILMWVFLESNYAK